MTGHRRSVACREFVEFVTAYLDRALPDHLRAAIDEHFDACQGCRDVLAQWRTVIDLTGRLTEADIERADPLAVGRLMSSFHGIRRR